MKRTAVVYLLTASAVMARVEDKETIRQSYPYAAKLEVLNVNGSLRVSGYEGNTVQLVAYKTIDARDAAALDRARREVRLDVQPGSAVLRICVDGPWRDCSDPENSRGRSRHHDSNEYTVKFEFELQVPASMAASLKTVNGGVSMKGVKGDFSVHTVNGPVSLEDLMGSGDAHTVNGGVKLAFVQSPPGSIRAKTVNGAIDATFPRNLNARMSFKTFNGDVFTNFPATAMANEASKLEQRDGRTLIRSDRAFHIRVGGGGPEHSFETLNGTIQIMERQ